MKLALTVVLGILASFAFTVFAEMLLMDSSALLTARHFYLEFPAVTALVGMLVGLIERNKTSIAGVLSLAPWSVYMVLGANKNHPTGSRWLITIVVVTIYSAIGIGAAILTAKIVRKGSQFRVSA